MGDRIALSGISHPTGPWWGGSGGKAAVVRPWWGGHIPYDRHDPVFRIPNRIHSFVDDGMEAVPAN